MPASARRTYPVSTKLIPVKGTPELQRRIKVAAAEDGVTYAELIDTLLDERERRNERRRKQMVSPLHRPRQPRLADLEMPGR